MIAVIMTKDDFGNTGEIYSEILGIPQHHISVLPCIVENFMPIGFN